MYFKFLRRYLKNQWFYIVILLLVIICSISIQLAGPIIISKFIDATVYGSKSGALLELAVIYLGISMINILLSIVITYITQRIGWRATNKLRVDLVRNCINLDMSFHKEKTQGELIQVIEQDVKNVFEFLSRMSVVITSNLLLIIGVIVIYFIKDYRMGIAQSLFAAFALFALLKVKEKGVKIRKEDRSLETSLFAYTGEVMSNTEDIKGSGSLGFVFQRFNQMLKDWLPIRIKVSIVMWSAFMVILFLQALSYSINFTLGTILWKRGIITVGTIYLFYNYTRYILDPINNLRQQAQLLQIVGAGITRINELLNKRSAIIDSHSDMRIMARDKLTFENVCFSYEEDREILKHISFQVKPGQTIGLLGRTGSGKTTLASLLVRFYDINSGSIKIGDKDIKEIAIKELRKNVVYVTQDIQILNASIRDNIVFFDHSITDDRIIRAIHDMDLDRWFNKFPEGLDTVIGIGGIGLSAGEAQLLAMIRAFLNEPYIVILDEVTSKLDVETERCIQASIDRLLKGRIGLVIAHRLQTIQKVDSVIILEDGRIIEYDKPDKLMNDKDSKFYQLLQMAEKEGILYE